MSLSDLWIVVIGASAGGMHALKDLVLQLPQDFPAPVFIVNHTSPDNTGEALISALDSGLLRCRNAEDGLQFEAGRIYVARPDLHLMIDRDRMILSKGARENRSRPAIDPLFRSAAVSHGSSVIGVILTGYLDDGTTGMMAIKRCGGICIAQDPQDAAYPDMPRSAIMNVGVDYCLPISDMGMLLSDLVQKTPGPQIATPNDLVIEARIAARVLSDLPSVEKLGEQVPFNCPDCGGVLWKIDDDQILRYRCHTGHAFTASVLMSIQSTKIEETLWTALRMFEERQNLLVTMHHARDGKPPSAILERKNDAQVHIDRIRAMLKASDASRDNLDAKA